MFTASKTELDVDQSIIPYIDRCHDRLAGYFLFEICRVCSYARSERCDKLEEDVRNAVRPSNLLLKAAYMRAPKFTVNPYTLATGATFARVSVELTTCLVCELLASTERPRHAWRPIPKFSILQNWWTSKWHIGERYVSLWVIPVNLAVLNGMPMSRVGSMFRKCPKATTTSPVTLHMYSLPSRPLTDNINTPSSGQQIHRHPLLSFSHVLSHLCLCCRRRRRRRQRAYGAAYTHPLQHPACKPVQHRLALVLQQLL